ncbi:MAG: response regulator transcription factor [Pseudomonadales bacterium]|nr:response regulator transcription factor [Pseudomonadales bacterium]
MLAQRNAESGLASPGPVRILVVEDDRSLNQQLSDLLQCQGYRVESCQDGEQGLALALAGGFDLVLLDVLLPGLDGFAVLDRLRQSHQTPVIMLTACGAEEERILGFSRGADDYLPKPFSFTELSLRIEALLRRVRGQISAPTDPDRLDSDGLMLDRPTQVVEYRQQAVTVTPIQFRLLWVLLRNRGEALSKPFLYQSVLEREFSRYDRSLDMHLSRVRRKLVAAGMAAERLQTVHGKGYCLR